jgi:hypothetical protein
MSALVILAVLLAVSALAPFLGVDTRTPELLHR